MRRLRAYLLVFLWGFLLSTVEAVSPVFSEEQPIVLESVRVLPSLDGNIIELRANKSFAFVTYTLADPDRLVIDPVEPNVTSSLPNSNPLGRGLIQAWRLFRDSGDEKRVDYLSFELTQPAEHLVESVNNLLVVHVRPKTKSSFDEGVIASAVVAMDPVANTPPAPVTAAYYQEPDKKLWSLESLVDFGLTRRHSVRVTVEELRLAEMKVREAKRALYPALNIKTSWTDGTASNVGFREAAYGLEVQQPLYYSGRLMETYQQALVNLQVAEKKQGKVKAEIALEIAQTYFQFIGAKVNLTAQAGLIDQTREFLKKTKARFDQGLLTRLELLNVEAQVNQAEFQQATAESDLVLARIKFLQRLNLNPEAVVEVPEQFEPVQERQIDLEETLALAVQYRPDIQVNNLLTQFYEFEERVAREKGKLRVDLTGTIGISGSAFETEPLNLKKDYAVGIRATESFGPHGVTGSINKTETSPRLGQTSRTASTVYASEIGILNQLQGLSEVQQAVINLEKARSDLEEAKSNVIQEVQEAYINYTKALLQIRYAKQKIAFRQEQVKILEAQASLNEALPSQVLEAIMRLSDERVGEAQALANYYVALARLNKAIGVPNYYR